MRSVSIPTVPPVRPLRQRILLTFLVVVLIACLISLGYMLLHNFHLHRMVGDLEAMPQPPGTRSVSRHQRLGRFDNSTGDSGCEYIVAEVRTYSGNRRAIERFYREAAAQWKQAHATEPPTITFPGDESSWDGEVMGFAGLRGSLPPGSYYMLYMMESDKPGLDCRCYNASLLP